MSTCAYLGYPPDYIKAYLCGNTSNQKYTIIQEWQYKSFSSKNLLKAGMAWDISQCDLIEHKLDVESLTLNNEESPHQSTLVDIDGNVFDMEHVYSINVEDGARLRTIGDKMFEGAWYLASANIPGVTTLGEYSFKNRYLTSFNAPDVITIKEGAFQYFGIEDNEISFPSATTIESMAFQSCSATKIALYSAQTIASSAFWSSDVNELVFSEDTPYAEYTSEMLHDEFNLDYGITITIGSPELPLDESQALIVKLAGDDSIHRVAARKIQGAIQWSQNEEDGSWTATNVGVLTCMDGEEITIGDIEFISGDSNCACTTLKSQAFAGSPSLLSACIDSITSLQYDSSTNYASFQGCSILKYVSFPNLTSVCDGAFYYCQNLLSVDLPNVTALGIDSFECCSSLESVYLPNVEEIGKYAFTGDYSLTSISLPALTSFYYDVNGSQFIAYDSFYNTGIVEYYFSHMTREYIEEYLDSIGIGISGQYNEELNMPEYISFTVTIHASDETFTYTPEIQEEE